MKELYVRVPPKLGVARFYRCGLEFGPTWRAIEADAATADRLEAEQMLEVTSTRPADYVDPDTTCEPEKSPTDPEARASGEGVPNAPEDPALRLAAIQAAIGQLSMDDASLWTAGGKPKTEAVAAITGWPVSAAERDAALAEAEAQ